MSDKVAIRRVMCPDCLGIGWFFEDGGWCMRCEGTKEVDEVMPEPPVATASDYLTVEFARSTSGWVPE